MVTRHPAEASFDYPSTWRQRKASFRRWVFDDFELDSVLCSRSSCHAQGEQIPERIDRQMDLTAFLVFRPIAVGASAALGCRLQGLATKDLGPWAFFAPFGDQ